MRHEVTGWTGTCSIKPFAASPLTRIWGARPFKTPSALQDARSLTDGRLTVRAACQRLGLAEPVQGSARLYGGEVTGLVVRLPGWQYPVVADLTSGHVRYDNFRFIRRKRTWT